MTCKWPENFEIRIDLIQNQPDRIWHSSSARWYFADYKLVFVLNIIAPVIEPFIFHMLWWVRTEKEIAKLSKTIWEWPSFSPAFNKWSYIVLQGCSWQCEWLLFSSCSLLRDDREEAEDQTLISAIELNKQLGLLHIFSHLITPWCCTLGL